MQKTSFVSLLLMITVLISCKKEHTRTLGIDVQYQFLQDNVQVFVDGEMLLNKRLDTNPLLGVCNGGFVRTTKTIGNHELKVIVNNVFVQTEKFTLDKNLYIGIQFDQSTHAISFINADEPFIYE